MAAAKKKLSVSLPSDAVVGGGGIRISITNQFGQRYRYRASAVRLNMRKGELQVVENDGRCFVWFDHCELEVRDAQKTVLFRLKAGAASKEPGAEIVILAELATAAPKAKARRSISPPAAARLAV
ncbi:MAG TPA: hypothetical protein VHO24_04515 [Opitutaceae bacterium]|nr:hypothetical protein [Opitutaceae bacterium]